MRRVRSSFASLILSDCAKTTDTRVNAITVITRYDLVIVPCAICKCSSKRCCGFTSNIKPQNSNIKRSARRRILLKLWQTRIHLIPRLYVGCPDVHFWFEHPRVVQARSEDALSLIRNAAEEARAA